MHMRANYSKTLIAIKLNGMSVQFLAALSLLTFKENKPNQQWWDVAVAIKPNDLTLVLRRKAA